MNRQTQLRFNWKQVPNKRNVATKFDPTKISPIVIKNVSQEPPLTSLSAERLALAVKLAKKDAKRKQEEKIENYLVECKYTCAACGRKKTRQHVSDGLMSYKENLEQHVKYCTEPHREVTDACEVPLSSCKLTVPPAEPKVSKPPQVAIVEEIEKLKVDLDSQLKRLNKAKKSKLTEVTPEFDYLWRMRKARKTKNEPSIYRKPMHWNEEEETEDRQRQRMEEQMVRNTRLLYDLSQQVKALEKQSVSTTVPKDVLVQKLTLAQRAAFRTLQVFSRNYRSLNPIPTELIVLIQKLGVLAGRIGGSKHNASELSITLQQLLACTQRKQEIIAQHALHHTPPKSKPGTTPKSSAKCYTKKYKRVGAPNFDKTFHHFLQTSRRVCSNEKVQQGQSYIPPHKLCGYCSPPHQTHRHYHPVTPILTSPGRSPQTHHYYPISPTPTSPKHEEEGFGRWSVTRDHVSRLPKKTRVFNLSSSVGLLEAAGKRRNVDQECNDVPPHTPFKKRASVTPLIPPHSPLSKQRIHFAPSKKYGCPGFSKKHGRKCPSVGKTRKRAVSMKKKRSPKKQVMSQGGTDHVCGERHSRDRYPGYDLSIPPSPLLEDPPCSDQNSTPRKDISPRRQRYNDSVNCKVYELEKLRDEVCTKLNALISAEDEEAEVVAPTLRNNTASPSPVLESNTPSPLDNKIPSPVLDRNIPSSSRAPFPEMTGMLDRLEELAAEQDAIRKRWKTMLYKDKFSEELLKNNDDVMVYGCRPAVVPASPHENFLSQSQYTRYKDSASRFGKSSRLSVYDNKAESGSIWREEEEEERKRHFPYMLPHDMDDRVALPLTCSDSMGNVQRYTSKYSKYLNAYADRHRNAESVPWEVAENVAENVVDDLFDGVAREIEESCDGYVEQLYSSEFIRPS